MITLAISFISAVLYRMGGAEGFNTKFRDFGCPLCATILYYIYGFRNPIALFFAFGIAFGAMTTYNKWASKLFGFTDDNVHWPSWAVTGAFYAFSAFPVVINCHNYLGFGIRIISLSVLTTLWSEKIDNPVIEELGRGFLFTATLPLLII